MSEVTVTMPLALTPEMMRAVRDDPLCQVEGEQWHARLGWLICAWDVLVGHRRQPPLNEGAIQELRACGSQMANLCFNWSQAANSIGVRLGEEDRAMLKRMQQQWDTALANLKTPNAEFSGVPAGHSSNHPAGGTSAGTQG